MEALLIEKEIQITKEKTTPKAFIKRCPMGGSCANPVCMMFGCIE